MADKLYGPPIPGAISPVPATDAMTKPVGIRDMKLYTEYDLDPNWKDDVDAELLSLDGRLDSAEGNIVILDGRLDDVENDINNVTTGLKARLTTAENDIDNAESDIDQLQYDLGQTNTDISALYSTKLDKPTNTGSTGDVIVKTASGTEYQNVAPFNQYGDYPAVKDGFSRMSRALENADGDTQDTAFIFQKTASENNTIDGHSARTAQIKNVIGHTVVYNQLCDGVNDTYPTISGRKYWVYIASTNSYTIITSAGTSIVLDDPQTDYIVDLTLWFGDNNNIPADLLSHPEIFRISYYTGSMTYNAGTFMTQWLDFLLTTGFNQWNEVWEIGSLDASTGQNYPTTDNIRSKNYIEVIPNTYYSMTCSANCGVCFYDGEQSFINIVYVGANGHFTTPSNCKYIRFYISSAYGASYKNDVCINISCARDGQYEPFKKKSYQFHDFTGNELLGTAVDGDTYAPNGKVTRKYSKVNLGSLSWYVVTHSNGNFFRADTTFPAMNTKWIINLPYSVGNPYGATSDNILYAFNNGGYLAIVVRDTDYNDAPSFTSAMSNGYIIYELATPTTEQVTPYAEYIEVDEDGTMETDGSEYIPAKLEVYYPLDTVGMLNKIVSTMPTTDGTYKLRLVMASGTPTFSWVSDS